ncbi:tetratricopeptide repeat protein [Amaricoccus solimangrovi]|uniref:Cell division coordinator CpoB n=1 Tax=Amaricoccus solimangrovi TaxID=2589815 RepID=A0A501X0Y5_9RHOB|nr:tetratricopeptide repeat protein [Amaricoccus solimangrovi]TPE53791.1 tetratricopeptide repeat protein [Amaricoccus solimangrovi]
MLANWRSLGGAFGVLILLAFAPLARAENVADVRAELAKLNGQIDQLRQELVKTGPAKGLPVAPATALTRLDQLQAELRRLTNRTDVLANDIGRIVDEATNRVGDIEFRLTELEGGDTSTLGKPEPLGGGLTAIAPPPPRGTVPAAPEADGADAPQLAKTERGDFDAAVAAAEAGDNAKAAELFGAFLATYPGGPLSSEAQYRRGDALAATSDWRGAARSYLDAFSGAPEGPVAAKSLYRLGVSLGELGQTEEACLTLAEVDSRYPGSEVTTDVATEKRALNCQP